MSLYRKAVFKFYISFDFSNKSIFSFEDYVEQVVSCLLGPVWLDRGVIL